MVKSFHIIKKTGILLFVVTSCMVVISLYNKYDDFYGVAKEQSSYLIKPSHHDDTLRVIIIGDSWASSHTDLKCDSLFEYYAKNKISRPVKCISKGHFGQNTKGIYLDMFAHKTKGTGEKAYCTQSLFEEHPNYCVIMVGINDVWHQTPLNAFSQNYQLMLKHIINSGIRPVVMEIPLFDIDKTIHELETRKEKCLRLASFLYNIGKIDIFDYREELKRMISENSLTEQLLYIPTSAWIPSDKEKSLLYYQEDHLHLNYHGYQKLDSCIVSVITKDYEKNNIQ